MILLLMAASLASQSGGPVRHDRAARAAAPCQAVPALCFSAQGTADGPRLASPTVLPGDPKMNAYRFDARPCRIIGSFCQKRANRQIFRLGEPIGETLTRSFGLD